jgi:hypothetical protein
MKEQNSKSHAQYVTGFHMLTFTVILATLVIAIILAVHHGISHTTVFGLLAATSLGLLFYYTRQFATGNQDRIIRAEENFRCYRLTGKMMNNRLTKEQIIALRFADDSEYEALADKAVNEGLNGKQVKEAIQKWRADHHRV